VHVGVIVITTASRMRFGNRHDVGMPGLRVERVAVFLRAVNGCVGRKGV